MSKWMLGEVALSKRVALEVHLDCGGAITPDDLRDLGLLLQGIARATRKWKRGVAAIVPSKLTEAKAK